MSYKDFRDGYMAQLNRVRNGVPVPLDDLNREYIETLIRGVEAWDRADAKDGGDKDGETTRREDRRHIQDDLD